MTHTDVESSLRSLLSQRILFFDGAMGTMIQELALDERDFRGDRHENRRNSPRRDFKDSAASRSCDHERRDASSHFQCKSIEKTEWPVAIFVGRIFEYHRGYTRNFGKIARACLVNDVVA